MGGWRPGEVDRLAKALEKTGGNKDKPKNIQQDVLTRICADCGVSITHRHPSTKRCENCATKRERESSKNSLYNGNGKRRKWGDKINTDFKRAAHDAQGHACIICGWLIPGADFGGCIAHHIISVNDGGSSTIDNAAVLCPNCHAKAHHGIISENFLFSRASEAFETRPTVEELRDVINDLSSKRAQIQKDRDEKKERKQPRKPRPPRDRTLGDFMYNILKK